MLTDERIAAMTAAKLWPNRSALDALAHALEHFPDRVYLTDHNSETTLTTTLSYRQIDRLSRRIAIGLSHFGVQRGDVVALQLPNWWEFIAIHLACLRIGAITNPLMPIFRERELHFMLSYAETKVLFVPRVFRGFEYLPMAQALAAEIETLKCVFAIGGHGDHDFADAFIARRWEDQVSEMKLDNTPISPNDVIELCYTSGTTGQPKGVLHTANTLRAGVESALRLGLDEKTVVLMASPLAHQTGFLYGMLMPLVVGGRLVLQDIWDARQAARLIHDEQVSFTMGATPFLSDLTESQGWGIYSPASLEYFVCAGAPIPRVLAKAAAATLGAKIVAGWGMSENGLVTMTLPSDADDKVFGTDGVGWRGQEVRVVDEDARTVPFDTEGALQTRGCANFVGYLNKPEAYDVDDEGWFNTGDNAAMDADGYIRITSRAKDIIIRGGENVPVVEVEELLYRHPAVQDAAIVAMPDPRLGERGCAFVSLKATQTLSFEDLQDYFQREKLAKNYWPERLEIIEEFPRTPSGKIQKFELREIAAKFSTGT